jgi:CRP-like cAMP-binding protein
VSRLKAEIVEFLKETNLLSGWPREELADLAKAMSIRPLEPQESLFAAGEPGDALYLLLEGRLSVWRDGEEIGDILEGDHLGEGALVRPGPRRVAVRGADPSTLAVLTGEAFVRLSESHPALYAKLLRALLRESAGKMADAEGFLDTPQNIR